MSVATHRLGFSPTVLDMWFTFIYLRVLLTLRLYYEGRWESKERLRIQPAQLLHCTR